MQLASSSCCLINYCDGPKLIWDRMYRRGSCPLFKLFIKSPAHLVINLSGERGWLGARMLCSGEEGWQWLLSTLSDPLKAQTFTPVLGKYSWKSSSFRQARLEAVLLPYKYCRLFCLCLVPIRNLNQKVQQKYCRKRRGNARGVSCLKHLLTMAGV